MINPFLNVINDFLVFEVFVFIDLDVRFTKLLFKSGLFFDGEATVDLLFFIWILFQNFGWICDMTLSLCFDQPLSNILFHHVSFKNLLVH